MNWFILMTYLWSAKHSDVAMFADNTSLTTDPDLQEKNSKLPEKSKIR